jgi:hypothetical protein
LDELVEAFLLRLPPDDPASLVRASLVCKLWRRILADRGFRRRFCELHRRAPVLGLVVFGRNQAGSCFTPTSSFRPRNADLRGRPRYAIDFRHGRVLFSRSLIFSQFLYLAVWDPISGDWVELPKLPAPQHPIDSIGIRWNAAVLCASNPSSSSSSISACDSIDCHLGHFLVVLMATSRHRVYVYVYSSQDATWSETTSTALDPLGPSKRLCPVGLAVAALASNALYFKEVSLDLIVGILKYDLGKQEISFVNLPPDIHGQRQVLLTTTEYGGLGIARVESSRIHLWAGETGPGERLGWVPSRVIELNTMLPANTHSIVVVAFLHSIGAFLVSTNDGVFSVDPESNRAMKVCEGSCGINVVPYMCFCTPGTRMALLTF